MLILLPALSIVKEALIKLVRVMGHFSECKIMELDQRFLRERPCGS